MSCFGYRRELSKYEDVDEDELLASLSPEELAELEKELTDIAPDDNIPIGLRQRDQTDKTPTGTFSREALMKYWETETRKLLEDEISGSSSKAVSEDTYLDSNKESVYRFPLSQSNTSACAQKQDEESKEESGAEETSGEEDEKDAENEKELKGYDKDNKFKAETCKDSVAPTPQAEAQVVLKPQRAEPIRRSPPPPPADPSANGNPTVVDEALQGVLRNDCELREVNLNNIDNISQETLVRFAEALRTNTHVRVFSLANTRADDTVALAIAKMLKENSSITSLNVESNFVTGKGVMALVQALPGNNTLTELRFHNQRHMCGGQVEMEMVKILRENHTLIKLGYQFNLPGPRMSMTGILTRNQDRQRQRRLQEQRQQQGAPEGPVNPRTTLLKGTPPRSPCTSPWSSPKLPRSDIPKKQTPPAPPPLGGGGGGGILPPPPPPPPAPLPQREKKPTRMIAEVIRAHEAGGKKAAKTKGKKSKKGKSKEAGAKETGSILKELKNALRPVTVDRRGEEGSRPSTPMRSAHDQLMESIRNSSIRNLKRVEIPQHLR
uniref:Leiomodin-2 n=1 Tax=Tetraodon nigroviridis TaxID=99883 RepID=H3DMB1_TETNG